MHDVVSGQVDRLKDSGGAVRINSHDTHLPRLTISGVDDALGVRRLRKLLLRTLGSTAGIGPLPYIFQVFGVSSHTEQHEQRSAEQGKATDRRGELGHCFLRERCGFHLFKAISEELYWVVDYVVFPLQYPKHYLIKSILSSITWGQLRL